MTDREGFLARWSRKKLEPTDVEAPATPNSVDDAAAVQPKPTDERGESKAAQPAQTAPTPAFDIASLPSIESITQATDVRAFLAPGVPPELTRAALRRAWVADPAIRDFVGLQENDWVFNNPTGLPGFGELPPGTDIRKLLAQVFGEADKGTGEIDAPHPPPSTAADTQVAAIAEESTSQTGPLASLAPPEAGAAGAEATAVPQLQGEIVHRDNNIASQHSNSRDQAGREKIPRPHGRALPK